MNESEYRVYRYSKTLDVLKKYDSGIWKNFEVYHIFKNECIDI